MERLRREIQRYRNELSNRETNFNRMFSDKNPLNLTTGAAPDRNSRLAKHKSHTSSPSFETGVALRVARERSSLETALMREKTLDMPKERLLAGVTSQKQTEDLIEHFQHEGKVRKTLEKCM